LIRSGTDVHGLAKLRLKLSAKDATDDSVMEIIRLISDDVRQENQTR
jgi:hypothetical protein